MVRDSLSEEATSKLLVGGVTDKAMGIFGDMHPGRAAVNAEAPGKG